MSCDPRHELGRAGEELAAEHLERLGYRVLERNFRTRWGELDIVAFDGRTLCFIEVKTRRRRRAPGAYAEADEPPVVAITPRKRFRVRRMAGSWLAERRERPWAREIRFDAIGVVLGSHQELLALDHLEGVF